MPSHVIRQFTYDARTATLDVEFVSGRRYRYHDVPEFVAEAMRVAFSKGEFFNANIRDRFRFTRLAANASDPMA
jgi:lysyl-tRNA synthetase class 2